MNGNNDSLCSSKSCEDGVPNNAHDATQSPPSFLQSSCSSPSVNPPSSISASTISYFSLDKREDLQDSVGQEGSLPASLGNEGGDNILKTQMSSTGSQPSSLEQSKYDRMSNDHKHNNDIDFTNSDFPLSSPSSSDPPSLSSSPLSSSPLISDDTNSVPIVDKNDANDRNVSVECDRSSISLSPNFSSLPQSAVPLTAPLSCSSSLSISCSSKSFMVRKSASLTQPKLPSASLTSSLNSSMKSLPTCEHSFPALESGSSAEHHLWSVPTTFSDAPGPRAAHSCDVIGTFMYIFGGWNGKYALNDLYVLDINAFHWYHISSSSSSLPVSSTASSPTALSPSSSILTSSPSSLSTAAGTSLPAPSTNNHDISGSNGVGNSSVGNVTRNSIGSIDVHNYHRNLTASESTGRCTGSTLYPHGRFSFSPLPSHLSSSLSQLSASSTNVPSLLSPSSLSMYLSSLPDARNNHSTATVNDCIYIHGGHDGTQWLSDMFMLETNATLLSSSSLLTQFSSTSSASAPSLTHMLPSTFSSLASCDTASLLFSGNESIGNLSSAALPFSESASTPASSPSRLLQNHDAISKALSNPAFEYSHDDNQVYDHCNVDKDSAHFRHQLHSYNDDVFHRNENDHNNKACQQHIESDSDAQFHDNLCDQQKTQNVIVPLSPIHACKWVKLNVSGVKPSSRACHTLSRVNEKLYMFGGYDGQNCFNDIDVFDIETNAWIQPAVKGEKPLARNAHTMTVLGNRLILFGGHSGNKHLTDLHIFDTITLTWMRPDLGGILPPGLRGHTANLVGSKVFILGGYDGKVRTNEIYILDTKKWTWVASRDSHNAPSGRQRHSSALIASRKIMVFGGFDGSKWLNDMHLLDVGRLEEDELNMNSAKQLISNMRTLINNPDFSDIILTVENKNIYAHRNILAANCDYFRNMFLGYMQESTQRRVIIHGWTYTAYIAFMEFLYTGKLSEERPGVLCEIMGLADHYTLSTLKKYCENILMTLIDIDSVCKLLKHAEIFNASNLKKSCLDFVLRHADQVTSTPQFDELQSIPSLVMEIAKMSLSKNRKHTASTVNS